MTKTYHHNNLANTLRKSAMKQIKKIGVNNLSLRQLAKDCNVSPTAVYRHFNNKEHLVADLSEVAYNEFTKALLSSGDGLRKIEDKFLAQGIAYVEFALDHPTYFDLMFGIHIEIEQYPSTHQAALNSYNALFVLINSLSPKSRSSTDIERSTQAAWAQVHGLAILMQKNLIPIGKNRKLSIKKIILADL